MTLRDDVGALFTLGSPDWSQSWTCRPVSFETARQWLPRYHYSGDVGHTGADFYGVFAPELVAVVGVGPPTNAHGQARRFDLERFPGNREITRVAVHPNAPRNAASRSVALVGHEVARLCGWEWLFSYADTGQGHHGGIYQALNAIYVGMNVGGTPPPAFEIREGGVWRPVASRTLQRKCGTARSGAVSRLAIRGVEVRIVAVEKPGKHTYILPIGGPASRRAVRRHLAQYALPYPKPL